MKMITRHTDYAIAALCALSKSDAPLTALALCDQLDMPYAFLRGILQKLQRHKLLISGRGKSGGFALAKSLDEITLFMVMEIFQDTFKTNGCVFKKHPCPRQKSCILRSKLTRIEELMRQEFQAVPISSLIQSRKSTGK